MNAGPTARARFRDSALVVLLALALFLPGLGRPVVQREQELRVALTARPMAEGGSWLNPTYLGEPRIRKPPMMYWLVAACYRAGGDTRSAALARLPSAVAATALAWLVYFIGRSLRGRRTGLWAALICATSLIVLRQARLAETDIPLTFWTTLAAWQGYRVFFRGARFGSLAISGLAAGAGFLTKGPAALALPLACWAALFALRPAPRAASVRPPAALATWLGLALATGLSWYLYLYTRSDSLAQLRQELAATYGDETGHPGPWYYYGYALFHAFAPWSVLLPGAIAYAVRQLRAGRAMSFAAAVFLAGLLLLSLTPSKQIHYAALLAPAFSLLAASYLRATGRRTPWLRPARRWAPALAVALPAAGLFVAVCVMPAREPLQLIARQLRAQADAVAGAEQLILVGRHRATVEFHAGRPVRDVDNLREAWRVSRPGDLIAVNTTADAPPAPPGPADLLAEGRHRGLHAALWRRR